MSEPESQAPLASDPEGYAPSVARRIAFYQRAGGIVTPLMTAVIAFLMGGIVVLATGHNPWRTYKAIFEGSGLNWFFHFGNYSIDVPFTDHARVVLVGHEHESHRRLQPDADAADDDAADPHRARGRVRVPLRPLQHRRSGPVPHRRDRRRLHRLAVHRHGPVCRTSSSRSSPLRSPARSGVRSPAS